jgi:APA family basic amino acid/polyamine antiporter
MSFINFWGIRESARLNTIFSLIEIAGLVFVVTLALFFGNFGSVNYLEMPQGIPGALSASALIFFAYIGFEDLANISEEVKNPKKNVPKALLLSIIITTAIYVLVGIAVVSLIDWRNLAASSAPLALAVSTILGNQGFFIMSVIALFATANTVLVGLIVSSREIYGMSRDGSLPKTLSRIHRNHRTPWIAVVVSMIFSIAFVLLGHINIVASITDFGTFYIFIFVNLSTIALRYKMPQANRMFRTPLNIGRFPIIPLLGLLSSILLLFHLSIDAISIGLGVAVIGVIAYLILYYTRMHVKPI